MPTVKIYDIVTNDKYEFPLKYHLVGAKSVAKYMGMTEEKVRKCLHYGKWNGEYKAIEAGIVVKSDRHYKEKGRAFNRSNYVRHIEMRKRYQREKYRVRAEIHAKQIDKSVIQYDKNGECIRHWESVRKACGDLGLCPSSISKCCKGKLKSTGGFTWKFAE